MTQTQIMAVETRSDILMIEIEKNSDRFKGITETMKKVHKNLKDLGNGKNGKHKAD